MKNNFLISGNFVFKYRNIIKWFGLMLKNLSIWFVITLQIYDIFYNGYLFMYFFTKKYINYLRPIRSRLTVYY
jgi:hypothetical protein